jgi:hypothetical protein
MTIQVFAVVHQFDKQGSIQLWRSVESARHGVISVIHDHFTEEETQRRDECLTEAAAVGIDDSIYLTEGVFAEIQELSLPDDD